VDLGSNSAMSGSLDSMSGKFASIESYASSIQANPTNRAVAKHVGVYPIAWDTESARPMSFSRLTSFANQFRFQWITKS